MGSHCIRDQFLLELKSGPEPMNQRMIEVQHGTGLGDHEAGKILSHDMRQLVCKQCAPFVF